ncbi:hypothetical protein GT23_1122 [Parageobacillus thermoglucosidasius]|nr:hypothetical protein GT23_1122 [Parageobacillus thermoglucosidasius]
MNPSMQTNNKAELVKAAGFRNFSFTSNPTSMQVNGYNPSIFYSCAPAFNL